MKRQIIKPIYIAIVVLGVALFFVYEAMTSQNITYDFSFVGYGGTYRYHDLTVFGIPVYWFMMLLGLVITFYVSFIRKDFYKLNTCQAVVLPIIFFVISFVGAKILYLIESRTEIKYIKLSGMSLFGAIFLVLILTPIVARLMKLDTLKLYDIFTPFGLILLASVRTGCFFNGCCSAVTFWYNTVPVVLPVQLFEVVCDLLILEVTYKMFENKKTTGFMYPTLLLLYGICRFLLEFLRKTPKNIIIFSNGQIYAFISIICGLGFIMILKRKPDSAKLKPPKPS